MHAKRMHRVVETLQRRNEREESSRRGPFECRRRHGAALLLQRNDATVTVVHSRTKNPEEAIREADIVIAACGVTEYVQGSWLKPGAAVIDVGINAKDDATKKLRIPISRRLRFRELQESCREDDAGPRWCRADDDCDFVAKHVRRGSEKLRRQRTTRIEKLTTLIIYSLD